jgi:hypothetical protein
VRVCQDSFVDQCIVNYRERPGASLMGIRAIEPTPYANQRRKNPLGNTIGYFRVSTGVHIEKE